MISSFYTTRAQDDGKQKVLQRPALGKVPEGKLAFCGEPDHPIKLPVINEVQVHIFR